MIKGREGNEGGLEIFLSNKDIQKVTPFWIKLINLCCLSIDKILFFECVLKKCKLCQNNPNANSIHIVIMPINILNQWPY